MTAPNPLYQEGYSMTDTTDQQAVTVALSKQLEVATDIGACFCIGCGQPDEPELHDPARCPAREGGELDVLTVADALKVFDTSCDEEPDLDGDPRALHCAIVAARLASVSSASAEPFLSQLRRVNLERYEAWVEGADAGIMFDALELGGEVGELLNVVKKLEREERGWRGSRANPTDFDDECGDVMICLDKLARRRNVDLAAATIAKFNATSEKVGLPHRLSASPEPVPATNQAGEVERAAIVSYIRRQSDRGADIGNEKPKGSTARAAFGGGSLALKRVADNIEAGEHVINDNTALATQPATSQEGEVSVDDALAFADQIAEQHRQRANAAEARIKAATDCLIQPGEGWQEYSLRLRDTLAATPTPPTLSEDLRALSERATQGEWRVAEGSIEDGSIYIDAAENGECPVAMIMSGSPHNQDRADAAFIVAAVQYARAQVTA